MSYRNKTVIVSVVEASDADLVKQSNLVALFEHALRRVAMMEARRAEFTTSDFPTAMQRNCPEYRLDITRDAEVSGTYCFTGIFTRGDYQLSVIGRFE